MCQVGTTDRLSTGTVIFPISKHIDYCLSQSDRTSRSDGIREKAKNKLCQSSCAKCHQSMLNWAPSSSRGRITSISASPIPLEPAVRTLFAKGLKVRIVPIAISMCQVPPIDSQEAPSSSRGGNTSISASPIPIGPAVRTLFLKRLRIRIVPIVIGICQVPPTDSQEVHTLISASPIPIGPAVRTLFAKRLKIRSVPIGMCQVPQIDSR